TSTSFGCRKTHTSWHLCGVSGSSPSGAFRFDLAKQSLDLVFFLELRKAIVEIVDHHLHLRLTDGLTVRNFLFHAVEAAEFASIANRDLRVGSLSHRT